jgi:hypothetical protein
MNAFLLCFSVYSSLYGTFQPFLARPYFYMILNFNTTLRICSWLLSDKKSPILETHCGCCPSEFRGKEIPSQVVE